MFDGWIIFAWPRHALTASKYCWKIMLVMKGYVVNIENVQKCSHWDHDLSFKYFLAQWLGNIWEALGAT